MDRRWYHIWCDDGCVLEQPTVGGVCFPRTTKVALESHDSGKTEWSSRKGDYLELSTEQVERVKAAVGTRVQRVLRSSQAGRPIGRVYVLGSINYSPLPQDEPLGKYLHIREVEGPPDAVPDVGTSLAEYSLSPEDQARLASPETQAYQRAAKARKRQAALTGSTPEPI